VVGGNGKTIIDEHARWCRGGSSGINTSSCCCSSSGKFGGGLSCSKDDDESHVISCKESCVVVLTEGTSVESFRVVLLNLKGLI